MFQICGEEFCNSREKMMLQTIANYHFGPTCFHSTDISAHTLDAHTSAWKCTLMCQTNKFKVKTNSKVHKLQCFGMSNFRERWWSFKKKKKKRRGKGTKRQRISYPHVYSHCITISGYSPEGFQAAAIHLVHKHEQNC